MRGNSELKPEYWHNEGQKDGANGKYDPPGGPGILNHGNENYQPNREAYDKGNNNGRNQK